MLGSSPLPSSSSRRCARLGKELSETYLEMIEFIHMNLFLSAIFYFIQ